MKKILLILSIFCIGFNNTNACLNYYYTLDNEGHFHQQDGRLVHFNKNFNKEKIVSKLLKLENKLAQERAYTILSDYAVGLMKLGKYKEAQEILAVLYKNYPNEYKLASNLGTAYELIGEVDSALKYIKRGLELNPNDHEGSEWIHVKILETKQLLEKNPNYLENHSVLQLTDAQLKDEAVRNQIEIQVRERFPFSPSGNDPIMASLMIDLGNTYANGWSIEYAKAFYEIAKEYYGNQSAQLVKRIDEMKKLIKKFGNKQVEKRGLSEGTHNKIGYVSYKLILDNNDKSNYQIDWTKINTDMNALLATVDISRSAAEVKSEASNNQTDGLRFVKNEENKITATSETNNTSGKSDAVIYYLLVGAVVLALGLYFFMFRKN